MKLGVMLVVSLGAHAAAGWALARVPRAPATTRSTIVEMTVVPRPAPPPPPPPPPPAAAPAPRAATGPRRSAAAAPRPRAIRATAPLGSDAPAVEVPATAEPVDFTDGPALTSSSPTDDAGPATPGPRARGSGTVPLGDLSRSPSPPSLDDVLARRYPAEARAQGRAGRAVARVRIDRDGRATVVRILEATDATFGEACRATVDGSRWRPPLDASGVAVATEVSYTCSFQIAP